MIARVFTVSPLTVKESAATVALPALRLASYSPVAGDRVQVTREGSQLVIQGAVV